MKNRVEIEFKNGELIVYKDRYLLMYSNRIYIFDNKSLDETIEFSDINSLGVRENDEDIS